MEALPPRARFDKRNEEARVDITIVTKGGTQMLL
jgi:hypothetical protein